MTMLTTGAPSQVRATHDKKRYFWPLSALVPLLPFIAWAGAMRFGWDVWWFSGPLAILIVIPIIDQLVGADRHNPPDSAFDALTQDRYYRYLTYSFVPIQYVSFVWSCWMFVHGDLSTFAKFGLALTVGAVGGIGIANAHELGHKKDKLERWLAKVVLAQTAYGHFQIEHNRGHHARVATPEDPASARFGETFWAFLPRCVIGSARFSLRYRMGNESR